MVIFVFVVDTSASMNQRTSIGTTLLDVAKNAVETFTKLRQRDQASRTDRYMLVTLEEPPGAIKAGWRENQVTFMSELRNLQANGLSTLGTALKEAFDLLNLYRLHSGIDNYGMGRNPFFVEPAMVVCITDGSKLSSQSGVQDELHLPMHTTLPGHELTTEPFRWDQRLFSIILRMAGTRSSMLGKMGMQNIEPAIAAMCDVTGGRCYKVTSSKSLCQALESLAQKVQCGVVMNFEKIGGANNLPPPPPEVAKSNMVDVRETDSPTPPLHNHVMNNVDLSKEDAKDKNSLGSEENHGTGKMDGSTSRNQQIGTNHLSPPPMNNLLPEDSPGALGMPRSTTSSPVPPSVQSTAWMSCRRMIYIKSSPSSGHWPVPESFWPDPSMQTLPSRDAHPNVLFSCNNSEPLVLDNLPFDKYELEPSPLTQYILERKSPSTCWLTFILNSYKKSGEVGYPFGYLKASSNLQTVNLFVMPYNFPVLFPVIDELVKVLKMKPTPKWKEKFESYLSTMPNYYAGPLRNAFRRMGIPPSFVPDHLDSFLSYTVVNYLKKVKQQSKMETERLISLVGKNPARENVPRPLLSVRTPQLPKAKKQDFHALLHNRNFSDADRISSETDISIPSASLHNVKQSVRTQSYKNPFDISRQELLDQVSRMRINFFHTAATSTRLQDEDARHSVAIAEMGNYQEVLRQMSPLREVDPGQNRVHMFGNPFKLAKDQRVMVDEADVNEAMAGPPSRKRPPIDNRPGSPKDRKRQQETPPVRWPNKATQNGGNSLISPVNNKVTSDKNLISQDGKMNNVFSGGHHGMKRKLSEGNDRVHKSLKSSKGLMKPQLARLQQQHSKGKLNKKLQPLSKTDANNSSKNDFVSSILKEAVTSQTRTFSGQGRPVMNSSEGTLDKNKLANSEAAEVLADEVVKEQPKGPSPRLLKKQLAREAFEENRLIRNSVFKEIRRPEISDEDILDHVSNLKGSPEVQGSFVREIIDEATLFKKKSLIEKLFSHLSSLQERDSPKSDEIELSEKKR